MTDPPPRPYRPCVGIVLCNSRGEIFAGERRDTSGAWQMPQGGIDRDEQPATAALRELHEELSVPASAVKLLARTDDWTTYELPDELIEKSWGGRYRGQKQLWFLYLLEADDAVIDIDTGHPEFQSWRWMTPEALLEEIVPFKRAVYERVLAHFRPALDALRAQRG